MRSNLLSTALTVLLFTLSGVEGLASAAAKQKPASPRQKPGRVPHAMMTLKRIGPSAFELQSPRGAHVTMATVVASTTSVDERSGDIRIRSLEDGKNAIFTYETGGLKIVHLGALDHLLTKDQVARLGSVDVLMVPVGGDAVRAHAVVGQLKPKYLIVPMHYQDIEAFRKAEDPVTRNFETVAGNTYSIDPANLPKEPKIIVLDYK